MCQKETLRLFMCHCCYNRYQAFQFPLPDEHTKHLRLTEKDSANEDIDLYSTPKITIAVYPDNIANQLAAHCSVLLPKVTINV